MLQKVSEYGEKMSATSLSKIYLKIWQRGEAQGEENKKAKRDYFFIEKWELAVVQKPLV